MAALRDVIVVGGGPAGLATALAAARKDLDVLLLERGALPADKACGEGLLPLGVEALGRLEVTPLLDASARTALRALRWVDGELCLDLPLPGPGGLGVRRTALSAALAAAARAAGVEVREGWSVSAHRRAADHVEVRGPEGAERGRLLVAADGLTSAIRRREGLELPPGGAPRFGLRRHFALPPWVDAVEVHFGDGVEAYVTPVGPHRVCVAFLVEEAARAPYRQLLARFPALQERLDGAELDSPPAGAGPLARSARARVLDRLVLAGDAGGYVDAITGEGLSLALRGAIELARVLPRALARGASQQALAGWERGEARRFGRYAATARFVLGLARRPSARRATMSFLSRHPRLGARLLGAAIG